MFTRPLRAREHNVTIATTAPCESSTLKARPPYRLLHVPNTGVSRHVRARDKARNERQKTLLIKKLREVSGIEHTRFVGGS